MDKLTDGSQLAKLSDSDLAFWLVEDAKKLDGRPGMNNVQSSIRQAAFRLDPAAAPWLGAASDD